MVMGLHGFREFGRIRIYSCIHREMPKKRAMWGVVEWRVGRARTSWMGLCGRGGWEGEVVAEVGAANPHSARAHHPSTTAKRARAATVRQHIATTQVGGGPSL